MKRTASVEDCLDRLTKLERWKRLIEKTLSDYDTRITKLERRP